ncbi:hypothetical protein B0H14DRAFT_2632785 [Mycena olivaceomarginata]|nr:hypothetical protein B0H14DRAFT_2632785 [Mycena olivaceomarginata]
MAAELTCKTSLKKGGRDGSDGGGDGVNSCGVGPALQRTRRPPRGSRPPPSSAALRRLHRRPHRRPPCRPALWWELGGMRWWRWWWLHVPNAVADMPSSIGDPIIPSSLSFTLRRLCPLHCQRCCGAPAPAPGLPDSAPSHLTPPPVTSTAKDSPWNEAKRTYTQLHAPVSLPVKREHSLTPTDPHCVQPVSLPVKREHSLTPTDPLLPKKSTMPGSHPNQIPGDLFTPEANKTSAEPLESPETPSHPSRLSWTGSQNMEGDLAMVDFDFDGIAELSMAADSTSAAPASTFTSAAPPAQPQSDDEDELEASPAQPTTAMHFEEQIGGGKWKEPPIERTPTKLRTKVTLTERAGQELRESAKSRAAAGEAALAAAAAAPADNTVADLAANALADPLPHPDDHRGLMSLPPTALNEFLSRVGRAPTFVERVVPGSGEPYDARFNRFLEVGGFCRGTTSTSAPWPSDRCPRRRLEPSRISSSRTSGFPASSASSASWPAASSASSTSCPAASSTSAASSVSSTSRRSSFGSRRRFSCGPSRRFFFRRRHPSGSRCWWAANGASSAARLDEWHKCYALAGICLRQLNRLHRGAGVRVFVKNVNVTSVSPRSGNAWNLYQAYSHSDEHEKAEYARALRVNEDLEDGEEPSRQQWQLTYDDFYLEFGEENADEILVTFGQLRHLGAQTHAQRARLFSKLFRNQEKLLLRTFENHGFEGCTILAGPILNEDAQVAKVSFTPGMKALPATLRMTEGDFLGACKLTAYSNQMGVINDLAGRSLPESASTACSINPSAAPVASAPVKTTMQVDDRADFPFGADPAAAAGPSTSVVTKKKLKPPANYDGLTSGEKAALQKRLAKERVGKLDSRKDQLRVRLAQASIADVGFNAFLKQNGGGFLWTSLGRELLKRRVRIVGYPVDARLPAQTKARKGSSAWRILDLNAFNRALQARSSAGHGLRLEKIPDSVPMGKGKEAGSTIVIATHDYNVPVPPGPISAVVARMRSSMGVAMPVMDGLDKMWMASFDLEKQQVPIRPAAFTDADALRLETAAMAQGGNEDDEDFEDGDVEDDGEEDDGDRDDGDGDDEDEDGDGNEDEAPLPKTSKRVVGKRKARDSDYESEEETIPPPRKSRYHHEEKRLVPIEPRVTRAKASAQVGGGAPTAHAPRPAPKKARVSFASDVDDDLPAQQPAPKKARMSKEPKATVPLALDEEDNVPIASLSRPRPAPTKPSRRVVSSPESAPHTPPPATSYRPVVEVPWHPQISPLHRNTSHARPGETQVSSMVGVLINGAELSTTPTASVDPPAGDNPFQSGPTDRKSAKRRRAPAELSTTPTASVDPPAGDNPFQSGPTDRKSAKRRRAPATSAAPDVGSSGSSRAPAAVAPIPGSSVRPPVAGGSSSARLRGPAAPAVAPAATTHAPAGSAIPPRPRSRTTAASGAMRAPAAPSATFAPARPLPQRSRRPPLSTRCAGRSRHFATAAPAAAPAPGGTDTAFW